mgnify:CR=1 FL=1
MMMAKDVSQRYHSATDLIEDLDALSRGEPLHFAQPALDFAKLAQVAKTSPASAPMQKAPTKQSNSSISTAWLMMLVVSIIVNLILIVVMIVSS